LTIAIVKDSLGKRRDFIWSLNEKKRQFKLTTSDSSGQKLNEQSWPMDEDKRLPEDAFNGNPEPNKLESSVYFVDGQLYFFENYVNYRWSWNRGNNRLTCVNWETGKINNQIWGQSPKQPDFNTFLFFDHLILYSNHIMHFQDGDGSFYCFDAKKGIVLDSLTQKVTLFRNYGSEHLLGLSYKRKQIKEQGYANAVEMKLWNHLSNRFSETYRFDFGKNYPYEPFVFPEVGLVILYYYVKEKKSSLLQCYRIK
jgi:hypothetical protein